MIYRKGAIALIAAFSTATAALACNSDSSWRNASGWRQSVGYGVEEARYDQRYDRYDDRDYRYDRGDDRYNGRDYHYDYDSNDRSVFSEREAIQIARSYGIRDVNYIRFEDDSWEIEGCNGRGLEIEIEILDGSGKLLRIERSKDWTCR